MTRIQVLDVGDRVTHVDTGSEAIITGIDPTASGVAYVVEWADSIARYSSSRAGWNRGRLTRVGGELQVGDWVRVTGTVQPTWISDEEELDDQIGVIVDDCAEEPIDYFVYVQGEVDVYECRADQLTRITRAEALA